MRLFKPSALDFFNKEYVWSFRDYRNGVELSMNLQEVIDSTNELNIRLNGEEGYCRFRFLKIILHRHGYKKYIKFFCRGLKKI